MSSKIKSIIKGLTKSVNKKVKLIDKVIHKSSDLPPNVTSYLNKYGNNEIVSITINRSPVNSAIRGLLNILSADKAPKTLFHLQMNILLDNGRMCCLEKNERISLVDYKPPIPNSEQLELHNSPNCTLSEFVQNTKVFMGAKFLIYSASYSNCQDFVLSALKANSLNTNDVEAFVKQDASAIFENNPNLRKLSNTVTDIAGAVSTVIQGGSIHKTKRVFYRCR